MHAFGVVLLIVAFFSVGALMFWVGSMVTRHALDEERKISAVLRFGVQCLDADKAKVEAILRQRAMGILLDVKKVAPWLAMVLAFGALASCGTQPAFAQTEAAVPQAQRTPMQDLQLRKIKLTYELLQARINGNTTDEVFAEQLLDDLNLQMQMLAFQQQGSHATSFDSRSIGPNALLVSYDGPAGIAKYWHSGPAILPDPEATPGMVEAGMSKERLCDPSFHTSSVRNVPESEKKAACREYGILAGCPGSGYELDHLISIELGGSNELPNLWPQPVDADGVIGFRTKDVVENRAHRAVCQGEISLAEAQARITADWYAFGLSHGWIGEVKTKTK